MTPLFGITLVFWAGGVLLHWLFTRLISNTGFVKNGYKFFIVIVIALACYAVRTSLLNAFFMCLEFAILWNLYTIFFINMTNSVSLRLMIEINQADGEALSFAEIQALYSDENALVSRLQGLAATGFITKAGEELTLTDKGRRFAVMLNLIRRLVGIEFYG